jgi:hypothetical protein
MTDSHAIQSQLSRKPFADRMIAAIKEWENNVIDSCILLLSLKSFPSSLSGWFPS